MASFNRVILTGNVTRDPEVRQAGSSTVCNFSLAVNEKRKQGDEWIDDPVFVDCGAWGKLADVMQRYVAKGDPVLVEGRLRRESWEKDGEKRSKLSVTVERLEFLKSKGSRDESDPAGDEFSQGIPF